MRWGGSDWSGWNQICIGNHAPREQFSTFKIFSNVSRRSGGLVGIWTGSIPGFAGLGGSHVQSRFSVGRCGGARGVVCQWHALCGSVWRWTSWWSRGAETRIFQRNSWPGVFIRATPNRDEWVAQKGRSAPTAVYEWWGHQAKNWWPCGGSGQFFRELYPEI